MANHPHRGWRRRWTVDLDTSTATHKDGWVFRFTVAPDVPDTFDGELIGRPDDTSVEDFDQLAGLARDAGKVYLEALKKRH